MNFIKQAYKGKNDWWMYILTMFLIFIGIQIASIPLMIAAYLKVDGDMNRFYESTKDSFMTIGIDKNLYLFLMIFTFMIAIWILYLLVKFLHKKDFKSIITSRSKVDWNRIWFAFILWGVISAITISLGIFLLPEDFVWNFKPIPFFTLLTVSLLFLPFQTSAEEIVFRGYLMQGLGLLAKNKWFPLLITSLIFGLMHGLNPEVEKLGYITMVFYIGTGLLFGIITLLDDGIELPLGLHAANNIFAAFFVTTDWSVFQTDALYIDTSEPSVGWETFIPVFVLYPILLLIFSKKYGWKNWSEKLFGKIEKPVSID
jgi:membrane protease YdiL (CAAX protease family)